MSSQKVQTIKYADLVSFSNGSLSESQKSELLRQIEEAYGPHKLGILTISGIPNYTLLRNTLLHLAQDFANLSDQQKAKCSDPKSHFQLGWSHGIEILENGKPDIYKGSYYANPNYNTPTTNVKDMQLYPSYARPNVWPTEDLPQLEHAFMSLGGLVTEVGLKLARVCDEYAKTKGVVANLEQMIRESICCKARLLHYFPTAGQENDTGAVAEEGEENPWCGVHCDHGTLTGLCRAMYLDCSTGKEVPSPDSKAGLYIVDKANNKVKVVIPEEHLGFQIGQAAQICTNGFLRATPHLVRSPKNSHNISRNTFAVFLQPHWNQPLLSTVSNGQIGLPAQQYSPGMNFGEFSEATIKMFHAKL